MVESCEAATMLNRIQAPRVIAFASSIKSARIAAWGCMPHGL